MEKFISVFDMFKIGVGPSSSHTLGPWLAALHCLNHFDDLQKVEKIQIKLYGSLAKTGKGHGTDIAVVMGIIGADPTTIDTSLISSFIDDVKKNQSISLKNLKDIQFKYDSDIIFLKDQSLSHHPNGLQFVITINGVEQIFTYFSIGGGFIEFEVGPNATNESVAEGTTLGNKQNASDAGNKPKLDVPFDFYATDELLHWCMKTGMNISEIVRENEKTNLDESILNEKLDAIWNTMLSCIYKGCKTEGVLPGGLQVRRRAFDLNNKLIQNVSFQNLEEWKSLIVKGGHDFSYILDWVSCFALAVNEENASFGRVVTAPTNGAAGVIPAVLLYAQLFCNKTSASEIRRFLMTASAIGVLFKSGATISAAMGGCQAEIGVSSAMAAAALTELLGGNQKQCLMAAEIAMEHHLGLTCDPIGGLVQIPCIERNTMGAIKAITAAQLALQSKPDFAVVSLDKVIKTMWNTALDMSVKYKETADGGLAVQIPIALAEC
ncbi:MAG: hypothetical protein RI940_1400 [Bacteroidota bacterium]|jgi:L-serine dehydratase